MLNPTPAGLAALMITKNQEMPDRVLAMLGASTTGPAAMMNVLSLKRQVDRIEELETQVKVLKAPTDTLTERRDALEKEVRELEAKRRDLENRIAKAEESSKKG